jgi:hypothetical protein
MQRWDEPVVLSLVLQASYSHSLDAAIHGYLTQLKPFRTLRSRQNAHRLQGGDRVKAVLTLTAAPRAGQK